MSAPGGFDPNASMLPDPGAASAPIHVMRGGAKGGEPQGENTGSIRVEIGDDVIDRESQSILAEYQLGPGGGLEDAFDQEFKELFVKQIKSGLCTAGTGSAVISHKDCSTVVQVLRELYKHQIQTTNRRNISTQDREMEDPNIKKYIKLIDSIQKLITNVNSKGVNALGLNTDIKRFEKIIDEIPAKYASYKNQLDDLHTELKSRYNLARLEGESAPSTAAAPVPNSAAPPPAPPAVAAATVPASNNMPSLQGFFGNNTFENEPPRVAAANAPAAAASNNMPSLQGLFPNQNTFETEPDAYESYKNQYQNNPPNFQEGHMRIDFATPDENKRVYANATIGRQRTRIFGRNAANLKGKYNSRKRRVNLELVEATNALARKQAALEKERKEKEEAVAKRKSELEAAKQKATDEATAAAAEAKRKATEAKSAAAAAKKAEQFAKEQEKRNKTLRLKLEKNAAEKARLARVAAGQEKPSVSNRFKGVFKRGGNKTRRNGRRNGNTRRRK
jgi:peptidoglycan hydrolase CwlO-like protein